MKSLSNSFKAVTWNVYHATKVDELEPILEDLLSDGVSMFLMQEAGGRDITRLLEKYGLETYVFDQYRLAWDPEVWQRLSTRHRLTSNKKVFGKRGAVKNHIVVGRFRHRFSRRKLKVVSYHTPAHVQRPEWNRRAPNRWRVLRDAMALFSRMARNAGIRHLLFGGDDNVDESRSSGGRKSRFNFLLRTGLKQIQPPSGTHGNRKIDDFRVKGLEPVGRGYVRPGGGDHKLFVCRFRFKARRFRN